MKKLRRTTEADAECLFAWANDPETRSASIDSAPIAWNDHVKWFHKVSASSEHHAYILEVDGKASGIIRFHITPDGASLSYTIAPHARGKGLSTILLDLGIKKFAEETGHRHITGVIALNNIRSQRAFAKVAFIEKGLIEIGGQSFKTYELNL